MFLKLDNTNIGKKMYPLDNSFTTCISGNGLWSLAGTNSVDAKLVTIISEPYKIKHEIFGEERESEFVTVSYDGCIYIVMNRFSEIRPKKIIFYDYPMPIFPIGRRYTPEQEENLKKISEIFREYSKKWINEIKENDKSTFPYIKPDKD